MSKNPSERKGMPGESEELNRETQGQQGQHKQGQKGSGTPDWKKEQKGHEGREGREGQQQQHRQGEPMGQQPKRDLGKQGQTGGADTEEGDDRTRRPA